MSESVWGNPLRFRVDRALDGEHLARAVSRSGGAPSVRAAKTLVDLGRVFRGDRREMKASSTVRVGERIEVYPDRVALVRLERGMILLEGKNLLAVHKPAGVPVEGSRGQTEGSLVPLLEDLLTREGLCRSGERLQLVHRLDRDTSGVLLVARNDRTRRDLEEQFLRRKVNKRYMVLVQGTPGRRRFVREAPVFPRRPAGEAGGRRRTDRAGAGTGAREGGRTETEFQVLESFPGFTLLEARPLSGRTHQIRIHLEQLGLPVLGDPMYGPRRCTHPLARAAPRQMLHASLLTFLDPDTGSPATLQASLPDDMEQVLQGLRTRPGGSVKTD